MEEIFELNKYFPYSITEPDQRNYILHHLDNIQKCIENNLYSSAFPHLHIVYMSFVYFQLLRISKEKNIEFNLCWIGFPNEEKDFLTKPDSPFSFHRIKEKTVFRFFRLLGLTDSSISNISSVVNNRNEALHANGLINCSTEHEFINEVNNYLRVMDKIIGEELLFIQPIYERISDTFDKDYTMTQDDIEISFGSFSLIELDILTKDKSDVVSNYIKENII